MNSKLIISLSLLAVLTTASAAVSSTPIAFQQDYSSGLDTNRGSMVLIPPHQTRRQARKSGYTYANVFRTETSSFLGTKIETKNTMQVENEMKVEDLEGGGQKISVTTSKFQMYVNTPGGLPISCDSSQGINDALCTGILDLVGVTVDLIVDEDGNIVEASGPVPEGVQRLEDLVHGIPTQDEDSKQLKDQVVATARMLESVTDQEVKPGDSWTTAVDMGEMGSVEGTSQLTGYNRYNGTDCAVLMMNGKLDMDMTNLLGASMVIPVNDIASSNTVDAANGIASNTIEGHMTQAIFWDYNENLALWSESNVSFVVKMDNLLGGSPMVLPPRSTTYVMTSIKDKPSSGNDISSKQTPEAANAPAGIAILSAALLVAAVVLAAAMSSWKRKGQGRDGLGLGSTTGEAADVVV